MKGKKSFAKCQRNRWTADEDNQLISLLNNSKDIKYIAKLHQRTRGAIQSRIKHIAFRTKVFKMMIHASKKNHLYLNMQR